MSSPLHVALIVETSKEYGRGILLGVGRYIQTHSPWSVSFEERGLSDLDRDWLQNWQGDGIITRSSSEATTEIANKRGIPIVNLAYHRDLPQGLNSPIINCDHSATAKLIAEYFTLRGFTRFGYCHATGETWSEDRRDAFVDACKEGGHTVDVLDIQPEPESSDIWDLDQKKICDWVKSLQKPIAVMAAYDVIGARVLAACQEVGVQVPEELAVVGVDNDPLFCSVSWPQLSSVDQNVEKIGFEAARLLASMMAGTTPKKENLKTFIPPREIVTRASSDVLAIDDQQIGKALRFIRENANRPINVDEVSRAAGLSRRELERRFQMHLNTSPYSYVQGSRTRRVCNLLTHTDDTLETISEALGFSEAASMSKSFTKRLGISPGEYRKQHKPSG